MTVGKMTKVKLAEESLINIGALQNAIFNSAHFSSIATDTNGVIQIFNVGAEQMLGYTAAEVKNKISPADISDAQALIVRAEALSIEFDTPITAGFETLVYKASREIEDIYEMTYIRKDGSRLPAKVSVTALRDEQKIIIGYLLIGTDNTAHKKAEAALVRANALQNAIFNSANFTSIATDANGVIQIFNVGAENMLGYSADEVINKITPADISDNQQVNARAEALSIELGTTIPAGFETLVYRASRGIDDFYELNFICKDGNHFFATVSVSALCDEQDAIIGYLLIATNNAVLEEEAKVRQQLAASVFTHAAQGIAITDAKGTIIDVNDTFIDITSYSREESLGKNLSMFSSSKQSAEFYADIMQALLEKGFWKGETWNRRKNGELYAEMKTISAVRDSRGVTKNHVVLCSDITQIKEHQEQLEHMANFDVLTGLPNRALLADRLSQAMVQCQRRHESLAVAFLDIDNFKTINDKHGHNVGDQLLIIVSQRMKEALREGDTLARLGGDEFIVVLANLVKNEDCQPVIERLLLAASEPVMLDEMILNVSASIGITLYPEDSVDADQLMRHADQAMYIAKGAGKNRYHLFDTILDDALKIQRENIGDIRSAFNRHEFVLYYQPKVNMHTGEVIGVEALIRWQHPVRGLVPPLQFLPIIEDHAISLDIGEWVIDTALTQLSLWQSIGITLPISVNMSAHQLQQPNFVTRLETLLAAHPDVSSHNLELEVLETSALDDLMQISVAMHACRELGVNFALDDFGTGYSSLTYLRRLPASLIKIDQSFVRDMLDDPEDLAIVEGVISLAKAFQREVIAEGVETIEHGTTLLHLGCKLAQGYGIARPMPASEIPPWLESWRPDNAWNASNNGDWNN
jgi:diguanylate cyclase (GGDEF)-like protein/PAS domain S-box-containing protein